jgi:ADP-dependent NAD(P)H-hydrate dehydratase / NAD(P)H-hydrate epimerase
MLLYQTNEIRRCEEQCFQQKLVQPLDLMERAGQAAWGYLSSHYYEVKRVVICCGKGNNGGDGLVLARLAHQAGLDVKVLQIENTMSTDVAQQALKKAREVGVLIEPFTTEALASAELLVDALLGIGLQGDLREPYAEVVKAMNNSNLPILSLDVPTGLNADTGAASEPSMVADATVTYIGLKAGMVTTKGVGLCGSVSVNDLALPATLLQSMVPMAKTLIWNDVKTSIKRRCRDAHKGDCGHVLVIGGDYGMGGAVRLSAEAALRSGAGLVTVATRPEHVSVVSGTRPELMCHQVKDAQDLKPLIDKCNVVVIGPGLGQSAWAQGLLDAVLAANVKTVFDADALNLLSKKDELELPQESIITPHPGEAARLLKCTSQDIQVDRYQQIQSLIELTDAIIVLKGAGTLVAVHDQMIEVCTAGNPGMATAGMGDVLTGIIGGLVAQALPLIEATRAAVMVHSIAADMAAQVGGERGLLATDLLEYVRELVNPDGNN